MANGTTRLALSNMEIDGNQNGQHEYIEEILIEKSQDRKSGKPGKMKKIHLKYPSSHNHSE